MALPTFAPGTPLPAASLNEVARQTVIPCASEAEQNAILAPHEGMTIYREDLDLIRRWDGTAWRTAPAVQSGDVSVSLNSLANAAAIVTTVTFPYKMPGVPRVTASVNTNTLLVVSIGTRDANGFQLAITNRSGNPLGASVTVLASWIAVAGA